MLYYLIKVNYPTVEDGILYWMSRYRIVTAPLGKYDLMSTVIIQDDNLDLIKKYAILHNYNIEENNE